MDLRRNYISAIDNYAFAGLNLTELNLGQNYIHSIRLNTFSGLNVDILDIMENMIINVFPHAWNNSAVAQLYMQGNPTVCNMGGGSGMNNTVVCICPTGAVRHWCVECPSTLHVTNVSWQNVLPEAFFDQSTQDAYSVIDNKDKSFDFVTPDFFFKCGTRGLPGQMCEITCKDGFEGVSVAYMCTVDKGQWTLASSQPLPSCVQFAMGNTTGLENATNSGNSTIADDTEGPLAAYNVATAGVPYYSPPPRAYGSGLFYVVDDVLPKGLTLAANGQIVGIPEEPGKWSITIGAMDDYGNLVSDLTFTLVVAPPLKISDSRIVHTLKNVYFVYGENMVVTGGRPPFSYGYSGTLPPGITLMQSGPTPRLEGYPVSTGTWSNIIVFVNDSVGVTYQLPTLTVVVSELDNEISFRTQFFIVLTVSVLLIVVSIILVGHYCRYTGSSSSSKSVSMYSFPEGISDTNFRNMRSGGYRQIVSSKKKKKACQRPKMNATMLLPAYAMECEKDPQRRQNEDHFSASNGQRDDSTLHCAPLFNTITDTCSSSSTSSSSSRLRAIREVSLGPVSSSYDAPPLVKVTTGTRLYRRDPSAPLASGFLVPLETFLRKAAYYSNRILVAAPLNDTVRDMFC